MPEKYIFCYFVGNEYIAVYRQIFEDVNEITRIKNVISLECYSRDVNFGGGRFY